MRLQIHKSIVCVTQYCITISPYWIAVNPTSSCPINHWFIITIINYKKRFKRNATLKDWFIHQQCLEQCVHLKFLICDKKSAYVSAHVIPPTLHSTEIFSHSMCWKTLTGKESMLQPIHFKSLICWRDLKLSSSEQVNTLLMQQTLTNLSQLSVRIGNLNHTNNRSFIIIVS